MSAQDATPETQGTKDRLIGSYFSTDGGMIEVGHIGDHDDAYTFGRCRSYIVAQYTLHGQSRLLVLKARFSEGVPMDSPKPTG